MTEHQQAVKRIIRYVVGTLDHGLYYLRCPGEAHLVGYSDHAGDIDTSKSMSGIPFFFGKLLAQSLTQHSAQSTAQERRRTIATEAHTQAISALHTSANTHTHLYSLDTVKSTTLVTQPLHDAPLLLLFIRTYTHTFCSRPHTSLAARTGHANSLHLHGSPGPTSMHGAPPCHDLQDSASS
jgi:hypothetical protein